MHQSLRVPPVEIQRRIEGLQREMASLGVHAVLIAHRIDLLYFSGCAQNGYLYVPRGRDPVLLIRKHAPRAAMDSPLAFQAALSSVRDIPEVLAGHGLFPPKFLGMAWDVLPVRELALFRRLIPARAHIDVSGAIHRLRAVKSAWEVERITESARVCKETLDHLRTRAGPGMEETLLAGLSEAFARRIGHGGGIRVRRPSEDDRSGWTACSRGVGPEGTPFTLGFRAVVNGYHAARARVYGSRRGSFPGARTADALERFHERVLTGASSGTRPEDLVRAARLAAAQERQRDPHATLRWSLHGIGLELREPFQALPSSVETDRSVCLVLRSRVQTSAGLVLCLEDTLVVNAGGVRPLPIPAGPGNRDKISVPAS
ncbi:MAG: aminopeptidase P family N-terminal domain-containing protein [Deltaproteobacteria bacterium]|nr:aminopeptidase P family N-terminal domain-containing protein [Deltaproteobacteria bacterium]